MIFNKPLLIIVSILLVVSVSSGLYIKYLKEVNSNLKIDNELKTEKLLSLESEIKLQKKRFEKTLETLELRENNIKEIETSNSKLKLKLQDIAKNEDDKCINTNHSESVSNLLRMDDSISTEADPSISP